MKTLTSPMILRNFRQIKTDSKGFTENKKQWFVPMYIGGRTMPVYAFDLFFYPSYRAYGTEYVRARDNKAARAKIKKMYANIVKYQWDDAYAG